MPSLPDKIKNRLQRTMEAMPGAKKRGELAYWKTKKSQEGELRNAHYKFLYTEHFGLDDEFYKGKKILDIGCGPRGSLEWADMTAERVGLDPLVDDYMKLGAKDHAMTYVKSGVEHMPFEDGHFDVVCTINSLDHVDDLDAAIADIKRITKKGGLLLLLVEVNHPPSVCEPFILNWDIVESFKPEFKELNIRHYENSGRDMKTSITGPAYDHENKTERVGMLSALFERV